jgi:hypothetical protein
MVISADAKIIVYCLVYIRLTITVCIFDPGKFRPLDNKQLAITYCKYAQGLMQPFGIFVLMEYKTSPPREESRRPGDRPVKIR